MTDAGIEKLVNMFQATLYRYVRFLGADSETAREVVQDTFVAASRSRSHPGPEEAEQMGPWLRGVARNLFLKACRARRRLPIPVDPSSLAEADACWTEWTAGAQNTSVILAALRECLGRLPERQRAILAARYEHRRPRAEMAATFGMTQDGVKSALRRVRRALADCIRSHLAGGTT